MVHVPDMLEYSVFEHLATGIRIYSNNMGCKIVTIAYMWARSVQEMENDYHLEDTAKSQYLRQYKLCLEVLSKRQGRLLKDLDWVMPVAEGSLVLEDDFCRLRQIREESKALVCLIDCSFIATCARMILEFASQLSEKKKLTQYEQYKLVYYQGALQSVATPGAFLTNAREIEICSKLLTKGCVLWDNSLLALRVIDKNAYNCYFFFCASEIRADSVGLPL